MKDINTSESYKLVELESRLQSSDSDIEELEARLEMVKCFCGIEW